MGRQVIFLDIDGVLNHVAWREQQEYMSPPGTPPEQRGTQWIDPEAVERLNLLIERTHAEVVLSSSWRLRGVERIQQMLGLRGFRGRLIDRTPLPPEHDPALFERLAGSPPPTSDYIWPRGYEIQQWLDEQPDVEHIVILDDSASMEHLMPWLVRTSLADGLCDRHIDEAARALQRPGPPRYQHGDNAHHELRWDMPAIELMGLVLRKLHTKTSDVRIYGDPESDAWPAARWRAYFEALDRWWRWAQLGRSAEARGDFAEASACLAAAVWLQPESADSVFTRTLLRRSKALPQVLRDQYDPEFPTLPFRERHRQAWGLGAALTGLPTLLRWSCDPRPEIRAQIYRSLGRLAHPAGIQVLQEGSFDPHPQARAAALDALRHCSDPTAYARLRSLAKDEREPLVREAAGAAMQSICCYWAHFGGWQQILDAPSRVVETAQALSEAQASSFAAELLERFTSPRSDHRARELLERVTRGRPSAHANAHDYAPPPRLAPDDEGAAYPDPVQAHADLGASGARGFEARRAFRFLGIGATTTRRAHEPLHIDSL